MAIGTQELELIKKEVADIREFCSARIDSSVRPLKEETQRIAAQLLSIQNRYRQAERRAILAKSDGLDNPRVPYGKYQGLDLLDLAFVKSLLNAQLRHPTGLNPRMLEEWQVSLKAALDNTTSTTGDELVPTQEAGALWLDVNLETMVAPMFSRVEMPSNPFEIPLQLGDVNWYPGTENIATTSTALSTGKQTLTAYELVGQVPWSLSLDEDSVVAMAEEVRRSLVRNAAEVIDDLLLNADTTGTNNINADGTTIQSTDAGKGH